jgi:hypothetical protein
MKFKISFDAVRYHQGAAAYELQYIRDYDDGGRGGQYWVGGGFFIDVEAAKKAAPVIKQLSETINFEV